MAPLGNTLLGAIVFFTRVGLSCEILATIAGIPFPKLLKNMSLISHVFPYIPYYTLLRGFKVYFLQQ